MSGNFTVPSTDMRRGHWGQHTITNILGSEWVENQVRRNMRIVKALTCLIC